MGFNSSDTAALNYARTVGFNPLVEEQGEHFITHFNCPAFPTCSNPKEAFKRALEAAHYAETNPTVWLEIQNGEDIPDYVYEAIAELNAFGTGIIVTRGSESSHGPGALRDDSRLQNALKGANRGNAIWHPVDKKYVYTRLVRE